MAPSTARTPSLSRGSLRRQSSTIRTGCANERPSGSARGVPREWYPYRDLTETALYRVNFEVNHLKPFPHLAFTASEVPGNSSNVPGFDGELMASFRPPTEICNHVRPRPFHSGACD